MLVTSDRDFFERLDPGEQKRFFEESYKLFSERYGKQNIAYATVHNDEQTPHMHLGVVPMRDLPADYPKWSTVYYYWMSWSKAPTPDKPALLTQVLKKLSLIDD